MIQVNLVPDIKGQYLAAQRKKRTILVTCMIISSVAVGAIVLTFALVGAQKIQLANAEKTTKSNIANLDSIKDLDKILTVQNQLGALQTLHMEKPVVSRIFNYLQQITPNDVQISSVEVGIDPPTMSISGTAASLESVNKFVDTLKFTKVALDGQTQTQAFTTVVLDSFGLNQEDNKYAYKVSFTYDAGMFKSENTNVQLIVPKITSTRSETERPNALFETSTTEDTEGADQQ